MNRNTIRAAAITLAFAFLISIIPAATVKQASASGWSENTWTIRLVDDWGKSLDKNEARGYLYNSTGASWENWKLLAWGDVWTNDTGSYITFKNLKSTWNNTLYGQEIKYSLVIKLKIDGKLTPITIYNSTILTIKSSYTGTDYYYYKAFALKDLGEMLQFGEDGYGPVTPIVDDMSDPIEVWLYYKAFKLIDLSGLPVTVSDVEVYYTSTWDPPANHTWITTSAIRGIYNAEYWKGVTNGTYDPPNNGLIPVQKPYWHYEPNCRVGWVIVKLPSIDRKSLVSNVTFLFYYHGTLVANFTATGSVTPTANAWEMGIPIDGTFGPDWVPHTENAKLEYNKTEYVKCNIGWVEFGLYDQNGGPWPTRNAKITLYDVDVDSKYPWPGVISPYGIEEWETSSVLLRYPMVNHTLKVVTTWFDNTVNVTYIESSKDVWGGFDIDTEYGLHRYTPTTDGLPGIIVDMVRVWIKVYTSTQVPAPLDPNWVDEVKIRIESRTAPQTTYYAKLTYWHGYIILPDTPFSSFGGRGFEPSSEIDFAVGWLPNGTWSTIDFFIKYKGMEVVNTVTGYPLNTTLKLKCPGIVDGNAITDPALTDYDKTFILYAGVYDVGFKVLLGCENKSDPAPEYTPLILTTPDNQRILVTTDGQGVITLRDVPAGTFKDFTILFKMLPVNCTHIKLGEEWEPARPIKVNISTKPLIELLFPVYTVNITVWNFEGTFKLINLNVSLYNTVDYSKYGINNDLLRRALDVEHKRSIVFPDGWVVLDPVWAEAPDIGALLDYLGKDPYGYSTIWYRTKYYLSGEDVTGDGCPDWPMQIGLMPAANYSCRVSVQNGTQNAVDTGFRPADYNATVYWSEDPYPGVGPIEVSTRTAVDQVVDIDIYTYIYDVPVQTLDASGEPLTLVEHSAIILAEPYDLEIANDGGLKPTYKPRQLWYMQQYDVEIRDTYNAYMVRFNSSDKNVFHSINASSIEDEPMADPDLKTNASYYPQQSRYLIGNSTLQPAGKYRFNVYYKGVLVFNESIALENPYSIGVPGHSVTGVNNIKTSVYPYVFEAINSPLDGSTFGIANLKVEVFWAGLNTSWWPTVNLTYRTAAEEFALLNASKHFKSFNSTVVERMWGNVTGLETQESITYGSLVGMEPYYSSMVIVVNGTTDSWGEFKCLVPVWNYSIGTFPTLMNTSDEPDYLNVAALHGESTIGGPKNPWNEATNTVNLLYRTTSIFGTPVFVNYTTIPGVTQDVPEIDEPRLAGVAPGYEPWVDFKCLNATGLINPETVGDLGGVSLTMDELGVRFGGVGVLTNNTVNASYPIVYGDFQGRSPELEHTTTKPYKEEGNSVAPPQNVANFFAKVDSPTLANDLWIWVKDYAGNALAYQRVEVIRANYSYTVDDEEIPVQPELLTVQYTPREYPYGPVKIASTPTKILWGFYPIIVRTTNLTGVVVSGTEVLTDKAKEEMEALRLYGHQWLYKCLKGGEVDWESQELSLQWEAKLNVYIKAGDGNTPMEKAWVFLIYGTNWAHNKEKGYFPPDPEEDPSFGLPAGCIDWGVWEIGQNVTAGLTDAVGLAGGLKVANARGPLATSDYTALNLGFNVYKDVYIVKVYYKYAGEDKIYGPVEGIVVWDTFTDQPQHRYIYLGVEPPETATGEDWSNAQVKLYNVRVWDLKLTLVDQALTPRPIAGATLAISGLGELTTGPDGSAKVNLVPAGKFDMVATWRSAFNPEPVTISRTSITLDRTIDETVPATVYDAELQLITPTGKPISGADVSLADVPLGLTGADGKVLATQVPSRYTEETAAYPVTAIWYGVDISPGSVVITSTKTYILTASSVATLTVQVVGAQGQGLNAAQVEITKGDQTVFSGVTNEQGVVSIEVPYGTYNVRADYKGFTSTASAEVSSPTGTVQTLATNVFIEVLGQAMTFATFILWIIVIIIVVLVLAIVVHEYHVWRRKRLPQLFGAPRVPGV
ncbi:MAG: MSCRAMM family protein [Thermoproteota archaeon]